MITRARIIGLQTAYAVAAAMITEMPGLAWAALPALTPAQQQAQAAKKAATDAQAEQDKKTLAASMDAVAARWRARAAANGWPTHPQTPVAPVAGFNASASQSGASGQPGGRQGAAAQAPGPSEKSGTATPSNDVKQLRSPQ